MARESRESDGEALRSDPRHAAWGRCAALLAARRYSQLRSGPAADAARGAGIVASNGTRITGFTREGINRAIGDLAKRAGTRPQAILDALKNPKKIETGVDKLGRPFEIFHGADARVIVNPQTGQIVTVNPYSAAGAL